MTNINFYKILILLFSVAVGFVRLMADQNSPLPSALDSFLSSLLPRGFAVGPSRHCQDRLGLWWVGRTQGAGSLLGREGDTEGAWNYNIEPKTQSDGSDLMMRSGSRTDLNNSAEAEKVKEKKSAVNQT